MNRNYYLLLVMILLFLAIPLLATDNDADNLNRGVLIFKDPRIDYLVKVYAAKNHVRPDLQKRFRVQVMTSRSRSDIQNAKADFAMRYPEVPTYMSFDPPTFRLRAGDFRERSEAEQFLQEIRKRYASSFIIEQ